MMNVLKKGFSRSPDLILFWMAFLLFVACGITGSSLGWYRQDPVCSEVIQLDGERLLFGRYRGIRGDEFIAHGVCNAIAQENADPRFPRFNRNVGLSGRDHLVLHDLGAPVRHSSMLGRPACWGFFFLDLRRALAWYWWFPIFLAAQFTFLFLRELFRLDRRMAWILTAGIVAAPCAAGWSFWPANNMAGIMIGGWALLRFSRSRSWQGQTGWSLLGGWGCFCAALSLYFPRVFSIGVVTGCAVLAAIFSSPERREGFRHFRSWCAGIAGLVPFLLLLCLWRADCLEALDAISGTVYPGTRRMYGGDLTAFDVMRGWLAPLTIYRSPLPNQSESQGVFAIYLPLLWWFCCARKSLKRPALWYAVAGSMLLLLIYQLIGLPECFADLTGLSRCNPNRCMMALHLGEFLMLALICEEDAANPSVRLPLRKALLAGTGMAVLSFLLLFTAPRELIVSFASYYPSKIIPLGALGVSFAVLLAVGAALLNRPRAAAVIFAVYGVLLGAAFNPLCRAPRSVTSRLLACVRETPDLKWEGRVLFATENDFAAVCHYIGGGRSLNGYFMYPDRDLSQLLYSDQPEPERFNRMNHLDAEIDAEAGDRFFAEPAFNDRIVLHFGPGYDFSQLPIDFLAALRSQKELLLPNPSLKLVHEGENLLLFRVLRP